MHSRFNVRSLREGVVWSYDVVARHQSPVPHTWALSVHTDSFTSSTTPFGCLICITSHTSLERVCRFARHQAFFWRARMRKFEMAWISAFQSHGWVSNWPMLVQRYLACSSLQQVTGLISHWNDSQVLNANTSTRLALLSAPTYLRTYLPTHSLIAMRVCAL